MPRLNADCLQASAYTKSAQPITASATVTMIHLMDGTFCHIDRKSQHQGLVRPVRGSMPEIRAIDSRQRFAMGPT